MLADAFLKVGKDGVITIEEGKSAETTVEVVEGMQFDRGFLSPHFVTDQDKMVVELDNAYVLIYEEKISSNKNLIPILEAISKANKPLLIIAEDVEGRGAWRRWSSTSCAAFSACVRSRLPATATAARRCWVTSRC